MSKADVIFDSTKKLLNNEDSIIEQHLGIKVKKFTCDTVSIQTNYPTIRQGIIGDLGVSLEDWKSRSKIHTEFIVNRIDDIIKELTAHKERLKGEINENG